jgi:arsenate reductase
MRYRLKRKPGKTMTRILQNTAQKKQTILFICTYNSVRSQIAEGFMRSMYPDRFEVCSAGIAPAGIHPYAIKTMREIGIDITRQRSKSVRELRSRHFDYVVTFSSEIKDILGPRMPSGKISLNFPLKSPSDIYADETEALTDFRELRDTVRTMLERTFGEVLSSQKE